MCSQKVKHGAKQICKNIVQRHLCVRGQILCCTMECLFWIYITMCSLHLSVYVISCRSRLCNQVAWLSINLWLVWSDIIYQASTSPVGHFNCWIRHKHKPSANLIRSTIESIKYIGRCTVRSVKFRWVSANALGFLFSNTNRRYKVQRYYHRVNLCTNLVHLTQYSISQEICTRFLLCCALLWLYIDWFSHIHQVYFTGTVAI